MTNLSKQSSLADTLLENSKGLTFLADMLPQLVWSARPDGFVDYFSKRWYDYIGATPETAQAADWDNLMHPDDVTQYDTIWSQALATGEPYEVEYRFRRASDQTYRWFLGRAEAIKDAKGQVLRWFGTCTDIDDQKRAELELARLSHRERNIAEMLQGAVQPPLQDHVSGLDLASFYRPALTEANVGGDFSDSFPLEKGCHCLVVGDLSGKGLAAAAQVAIVRNMLRYALYTEPTIAAAVTRLNQILIAHNLVTDFATLVVCTFDLAVQTLTYVSCGQEPALLRRTPRGDVQELPPTGPVLGMNESAVYQEETIDVMPGDMFALYTDGLTETGPNRRQMLGVSGLADLMAGEAFSAQQVADRIVSGAEAYSGGAFRDDVCLIVGIVQATDKEV